MSHKNLNITISVTPEIYYRIENAVKYLNLNKIYEKETLEVGDINDFIVGSVVNFLEYVELFASPPKNFQLIDQDKRPIKNSFKQYLKKHDIKQIDLAKVIGMEAATLNGIVNNNSQPSMESFIKIWSALSFPPLDEIIYRENN